MLPKPRIDKSTLLPEHLLETERISDMEKELQEYLLQPGKIESIYTHEGAHLYYFRQIHPASKFVPPSIYYHKVADFYEPVKSMIDTSGVSKKCDYNRLLIFAKAVFSGGIIENAVRLSQGATVEQILNEETGDVDDVRKFGTLCDQIRNASPDLPKFDTKDLRIKSQSDVIADAYNPQTFGDIRSTIEEVKIQMFASMYPYGLPSTF